MIHVDLLERVNRRGLGEEVAISSGDGTLGFRRLENRARLPYLCMPATHRCSDKLFGAPCSLPLLGRSSLGMGTTIISTKTVNYQISPTRTKIARWMLTRKGVCRYVSFWGHYYGRQRSFSRRVCRRCLNDNARINRAGLAIGYVRVTLGKEKKTIAALTVLTLPFQRENFKLKPQATKHIRNLIALPRTNYLPYLSTNGGRIIPYMDLSQKM